MSIKLATLRNSSEKIQYKSVKKIFFILYYREKQNFCQFANYFYDTMIKVLKHKSTIQQKKFNNLLKDKKLQHNPEKVIFKLL